MLVCQVRKVTSPINLFSISITFVGKDFSNLLYQFLYELVHTFDYNSTLFKQIGNDSIVMSNSSSNFQNGLGNSQFNYNSNRDYFSNTTNKTDLQDLRPT